MLEEEEILNLFEAIQIFGFNTYRQNQDDGFWEIYRFEIDVDVCIRISERPSLVVKNKATFHRVSIMIWNKYRTQNHFTSDILFRGQLDLKDTDFFRELLERIID